MSLTLPTRRRFVQGAALVGGACFAPALARAETSIVKAPYGVQAGDVRAGRAMVWSRADRPARMLVRYATTEGMKDATAAPVVDALPDTDLTAKLDIGDLPPGQRVFYEVRFLDLSDLKGESETLVGSFLTPPSEARDLRFVWSGDTAGQGWGINPDFGGMRIYEAMRKLRPNFFIHSGDTIYADGPIEAEAEAEDGRVWKNVTTEAKSKVAETLPEYYGQYAYNLMDDNLRRFNAEVPMLAQWDDHEVTNNWYWGMRKDDDERYREGSGALLAARGMRAFMDYMPVRRHPLDPQRLYESFAYGPQLEVFRIDMRSYRGDNADVQPTTMAPELHILGARQVAWLKDALKNSQATWKVIASDMPLGLIVYSDSKAKKGFEAVALKDGPPAARELEIADLLTFIRDQAVQNVVWLTADVHYTAAHRYDPAKAQYKEFKPFWEFVSGPLNSGSFGPNKLDNTFGPEAVFVKAPPEGQSNLSPFAGLQFFGQVDIAAADGTMTVRLNDIDGKTLHTQELTPEV